MGKVTLGAQAGIYPWPVTLVGAKVDGKPNFAAIAWCSDASSSPPMLSIAMRSTRYTYTGIRQNQVFSVNVPSADMVKETDYCGLATGAKVDKVKVCGFKVFYGRLENAPLIEQCPINMECRVAHMLELGSHSLIVGRIEEIHVSESCLTNGKPDFNKVNPLICTRIGAVSHYRSAGAVLAEAWRVGGGLKAKELT